MNNHIQLQCEEVKTKIKFWIPSSLRQLKNVTAQGTELQQATELKVNSQRTTNNEEERMKELSKLFGGCGNGYW